MAKTRYRSVKSVKNAARASRSSKLKTLMVVAPIALELATRYRQSQKAKRGRFYRPGKREQLLDTLLEQAGRYFGQGGSRGNSRGRGFF